MQICWFKVGTGELRAGGDSLSSGRSLSGEETIRDLAAWGKREDLVRSVGMRCKSPRLLLLVL